MAVIGIAEERADSPEAIFEMGQHSIVRKFRVLTSSVLDGPIQVSNAVGIPRMLQRYYFGGEFHPYCRVRSIDPKRLAPGSLYWEVTVTYRTPDQKSGGGAHGSSHPEKEGTGEEKDGEYENPTIEIPEVETHYETQQQPIYGCIGYGQQCGATKNSSTFTLTGTTFFAVGDRVTVTATTTTNTGLINNGWMTTKTVNTVLNSTVASINAGVDVVLADAWKGPTTASAQIVDMNFKPVQASTGEIFVPPPHMDSSRLILTITRNEDISSPHPSTGLLYQDAVNQDVFWGAAPGQVKLNNITVRREVRQLGGGTIYPYLKVTYVFHFKPTWDIQLLDKGSYYNTIDSQLTKNVVKQKFMTQDGQPVDGLLDGKGGKLADGLPPVFLSVRPYNWMPFSPLNLPQSFQQVQ